MPVATAVLNPASGRPSANDLPTDHSQRRMNWLHSVTGGMTQPSTNNSVKPTNWFNSIGHAVQRGRNSPSQLTHMFGNGQ